MKWLGRLAVDEGSSIVFARCYPRGFREDKTPEFGWHDRPPLELQELPPAWGELRQPALVQVPWRVPLGGPLLPTSPGANRHRPGKHERATSSGRSPRLC